MFFLLTKKNHYNNENLPLCIFKKYFNSWGTSQLLPFKYCPRSAREGQTWTNSFFCRLTKTAIYVRFSRIETPLDLQGSTLRVSLIEQTTHEGSSNGHIYFEDLFEDEPEASWCSGKISCRGRRARREIKTGHTIPLGEMVGELAGSQGVVGGTDGPGSGIKFDSV